MNRKLVTRGLKCVLVIVFAVPAVSCSRAAQKVEDPRLIVFNKFNRAKTYDEIRPLISGLFAHLFAEMSTKPDEMRKALNYLQITSFETAHIVDLNSNTSFLVLENVTSSAAGRENRRAYLLSRTNGNSWTVAEHFDPQMAVPSLWTRTFTPGEFNQASMCSVSGANLDSSLNGKKWALKSAVAFRRRDQIEIDLLPFSLTEEDLKYWKYFSGMLPDLSQIQSSSFNRFHPECRIVFGLDQGGQITFVNVGFNNPDPHFSAVWQGPGWSWAPPRIPMPNTSNGLPPEFPVLVIGKDRVKIETSGQCEAGDQSIRWNAKIDIPLWERGL